MDAPEGKVRDKAKRPKGLALTFRPPEKRLEGACAQNGNKRSPWKCQNGSIVATQRQDSLPEPQRKVQDKRAAFAKVEVSHQAGVSSRSSQTRLRLQLGLARMIGHSSTALMADVLAVAQLIQLGVSKDMTEMSADLSSDKLPLPAPTIEEVSSEVLRLDPQLHSSSNTFKTAVVLLSVLSVGQDVDELAWFTGYERGFVSLVAERMSGSGLWNRGRFACNWEHGDVGEMAFWCDVLVAEGRKSPKVSDAG